MSVNVLPVNVLGSPATFVPSQTCRNTAALNTDASVKRLGKGDDRPVNKLEDRLAVMASLGCVALVTWFDEDTPLQRILDCRPEILVKGGDWPVDKIVGCSEVRGWGGTVHSIPFIHQKSTTALLEKIRRL